MSVRPEEERLLLMDTCGDAPAAAISCGADVLRVEEFGERRASAEMLTIVRRLLQAADLTLADLDGIGVVSGPGSFTGVRAGMAAAKGLCEAATLPLAAVSRLLVLTRAAKLEEGFAVLDGGRGTLYVREEYRDKSPRELSMSVEELSARAEGAAVVIAEDRLVEELSHLRPTLRRLRVADLLQPARHCLGEGGTDVMWADANYVLRASEIYGRSAAEKKAARSS